MLLCYEAYQRRLQSNINNDPKSFWKFIKTKQCRRNKKRINQQGKELSEAEGAKCFADYFHSVYSTERPVLDPAAAERSAGPGASAARVHVGQLSAKELSAALNRLKPKHSVGPDGIPPYVVKDCREVIREPLLHVFNLCLKESHYPDRWKITRVIPVPKGSCSDDVSGYRPVAVLSAFAKVFETALHTAIFAQTSSQLSDVQHGFRPSRNTASNLLSFMTYVTPVVDAGGQVDCAYFDFRKAFDTVNNDILLSKLARLGFTLHLLNFFSSYLSDRQQYVEYAGHSSEPYFTFSGISQGSNLGPLEFILMINDLPTVVQNAKCLLFADDLKVYLSVGNVSDAKLLQNDISRVIEWSNTNKLYFNTAKCGLISFSRAKAPQHYAYEMDGITIQRFNGTRDLGVAMVPELTFRKHINDICSKAFRNLGFLLRNCRDFESITAIKMLYNALVRSNLESTSIIWNPHEAKYSLMLEKIQNKFTRFLYFKEYKVYPFYPLMYPSLFVLGMVGYTQLSVRRDIALATYVWRVLRGHVHHPDILAELGLCAPSGYVGARRQPAALSVSVPRTNLLKYAPLSRALRLLNLTHTEIDIYNCKLVKFKYVVECCLLRSMPH